MRRLTVACSGNQCADGDSRLFGDGHEHRIQRAASDTASQDDCGQLLDTSDRQTYKRLA